MLRQRAGSIFISIPAVTFFCDAHTLIPPVTKRIGPAAPPDLNLRILHIILFTPIQESMELPPSRTVSLSLVVTATSRMVFNVNGHVFRAPAVALDSGSRTFSPPIPSLILLANPCIQYPIFVKGNFTGLATYI